jgi:Secretion system C-terminal sorting domain
MTVNALVTPSVSVTASATTICSGTNVTFTALPSSGGAGGGYQWKLNGANVGTNAATYSNAGLLNGDAVSVVMTTSAICASLPTATSTPIAITVSGAVTPAVAIAASANNVCAGVPITFTATPTNGGTPVYQWKVNGANTGTNSATFATSTLLNNDIVTVVMTSNAACASVATATSNAVTAIINTNVTPTVAIATTTQTICAGASASFTATAVNGGASPVYQWKVNGVNAGTNAATFASTTLTNGQIVSCVMTSNANCTTTANATSNSVTMTVNALVTPSVSVTASATTICSGTNVTFTALPSSGGAGGGYQWKLNGANVGTNAATYSNAGLLNGDAVSVVMTTSAICASLPTATSTPIAITVNGAVTPAVAIAASTNNVCSGTAITFTASPTNGGTPVYQWKVNGTNAGTNAATFATSTLANNDVVTVVMTSNAACASVATATSNAVTAIINTNLTPTVSIASSATTICTGASATFTATAVNGGASPVYQWKVNGVNAGTNAATFASTTLTNGQIVSCVITSNANCTTTANATSNSVTMTVNTAVVPTVTVASSATTICNGTNVTFTATPTNGGGTPVYQWKLNGANVGINAATFASATLVNGDAVSVVMTTSAICASLPTATSTPIAITVSGAVTPAVAIAASTNNVCSGTAITFTASPTNGGTPVYQWKVNGTNAGTNAATFATSTLANNDVVTVVMTSNAACASVATATSNAVTAIINTNLTPTVSIASSATTICTGASATFTATAVNGGASPVYQWKVNGTNAGTNSATFTSTTLANGNTVTCVLTSNANCLATANANSNAVSMTVTTPSTPTISIAASTTTICTGASVTFTATATNGGTAPAYQWAVNGVNTGTNATTFTSATLANSDVVSCVLTSNAACTSTSTATSNTVAMTVNAVLTPAVAIAASTNNVCSGTSVLFTASPTNGGTPGYQWKVNGANAGTNAATFTSSTLANNDVVTVVMTSNAACASTTSATSNAVTVIINTNVIPTVAIASSATTICAGASATFTATAVNGGASPVYQWKVNGADVAGANAATFTTTTLTNGQTVTCVLTSNANCLATANASSNAVSMTVTTPSTPTISIAASTTTICTGASVTFTATATNGGTPVYTWKVNGLAVGTNAATFTTTALANSDVVTCILTSNAACTSTSTATSNAVAMTVNATVTPTVSIAASTNNVCAGTAITFTALPSFGGSGGGFQWKVNGVNAGTNSATFVSSTLTNGQVVTCVMTSNAICASTTTATSNAVTATVSPTVTPTLSIAPSATTICGGTNVTFTATAVNGGSAPSYQWKVNGVNAGTDATTFASTTLTNGDIVTCVLTSNANCATLATAAANSITMNVNAAITPAVSIATNTPVICAGTAVTFTASATNGGTTPIYQWAVNGLAVGPNSPNFTTTGLLNNDLVTVRLTSNAACLASANANSNAVLMTVNTPVTPSVLIAASANSICTGTAITFSATPTNGGIAPSYQWKVNGTNVGTDSPTFASATLANGDIVRVVMSSTANCSAPLTATSNAVTTLVTSAVTPSVLIAASTTNICAGASVTFTATPTNGGATPTYQWRVNGANVGGSTVSFTTNTLANTDVVTCELTSSAACASAATAASNPVAMTVNTAVTPAVVIAASSAAICTGTNVVFTATPTSAGTNPVFQWKVNGVNAGTNSPTFASSTLTNGVTVTCVMTSNVACATANVTTSNPVAMSVGAPVTASLAIASSNNVNCAGATITFAATPTNGGITPAYQWKVNGVNVVGETNATFSSTTLANNSIVACTMVSNAACVSNASSVSNNIVTTVNPIVTATVALATTNTTICSGASATFVATPTNAGTTPTFAWTLNGSPITNTGNTYTSTNLANGDVVGVTMAASNVCSNPQSATAAPITMLVTPATTPSLSIASNVGNTLCSNAAPAQFTATANTNGTYQWTLNGVNAGSNSTAFSPANLANGDLVACTFTTTAACATQNSIAATPIAMTIKTAPTAPILNTNATLCDGSDLVLTTPAVTGLTYQWTGPNSTIYNGNTVTIPAATTAFNGNYAVVVTQNGCSATSQPLVATIHPTPFQPTIERNGFVLTSSALDNNQWFFNNEFMVDATKRTLTITKTGYYQVQIKNAFGCTNKSDSIQIVVPQEDALRVYPNPTTDNLYISLRQPMEIDHVDIFGEDGRLIYTETNPKLADGRYTIDVTNLNSGFNYIVVYSGTEVLSTKFVKIN